MNIWWQSLAKTNNENIAYSALTAHEALLNSRFHIVCAVCVSIFSIGLLLVFHQNQRQAILIHSANAALDVSALIWLNR